MDVVQDTFLKLFQQMDQSSYQIENQRAWLYKVAGNNCLNLLNISKRQKEINGQLEFQTTEKSDPESTFISNENTARVRKAVNSLSPQNQMLLLLYQDGLSYKEMSEATAIPINSIGKTLWRNIEKISQKIKKDDHE